MSDDFFGDLDKKISALSAKRQAAADNKEANRAFSERAIQDMHPVAEKYAAGLRERGIGAQVSGKEGRLAFEMRWADGAKHRLSVYPDPETGDVKIFFTSTDHTNGREFSYSRVHSAREWKPSLFEDALESEINGYMAYADKHGGVA